MDFIHEPTPSSGNHYIECPFPVVGDGTAISNPRWSMIFTIWTSMTGPIIVPPGSAAKILDCGCARESMYSLQYGMICPKPSSSSGRVLEFIPADTCAERCEFANPCESNCLSQWFEVLIVSPQTASRYLFWRDTNSFTSCDFTHVNTSLATDSFCFSCPFSPSGRIVHTNSKLLRKYWADLQNEWSGIRVRCSKHPYWSVWCLCLSSFSEFHNQKHQYSWILDDLYLWIVPPFDWL